MEELEILRIMNKYNPWWNNKPIPENKRSNFKRGDFYFIQKQLANKQITSVIGPRRVGKTIVIHQLIEDLLQNRKVDSKRIFYLSVDELELKKGQVELKDILEVYSKYIAKKAIDSLEETHYFFLDEIQEMEDWEKILKNWYDLGYKIKFVISGSSSIWISRGTEESLLGRIKTSVMMPLKFSEILRYRNILPERYTYDRKALRDAFIEAIEKKEWKILFEVLDIFMGHILPKKNTIEIELNRYLTVGGYPEFLEVKEYSAISEEIRNKIKLVLYKDIVKYFKIRNPSVLEDLLKMLSKSSGAYFNLADTAKILDIQRPTLKNYISYLTKAYLMGYSEFFSESRRKRVRKQKKVYLLDAGIRNALVDFLDDTLISSNREMGVVVEGVLFDHLTRLKFNLEPGPQPRIFYWKNRKEIDFVINIKRTPIPIESKFTSKIAPGAFDEINNFIEEHKSPFGIIITKDYFGVKDNILLIPLWVFLLII